MATIVRRTIRIPSRKVRITRTIRITRRVTLR